MTTKLNRAKQSIRDQKRQSKALRKALIKGREIVRTCCPSCDYDEAEGDLLNHCDKCCRRITRDLYIHLLTSHE